MPEGAKSTVHTSMRAHASCAALGLALMAGAFVAALSLQSSGQSWLGWVTLLPLFYAVRTQRPLRAMLSGAFWGCCLYAFGTTVLESGIAHGLTSFLLLSGAPAAYAFTASLLTRRIGFNPFVLGVSWMAVELALQPLGLQNGLLAGTQGDGTLMHWLGGALGYVLVAFTVAFVNAVLVTALSAVCEAISTSHDVPRPTEFRAALCAQTFTCFPLFHIPVAQPRAPPA